MRIKFEATDASGKVHKRSSTSHVYSHCLVIHFAAHPASNLWPKGIAACSHAEWAASRALAERNANPTRYIWNAKGQEILAKIHKARQALPV